MANFIEIDKFNVSEAFCCEGGLCSIEVAKFLDSIDELSYSEHINASLAKNVLVKAKKRLNELNEAIETGNTARRNIYGVVRSVPMNVVIAAANEFSESIENLENAMIAQGIEVEGRSGKRVKRAPLDLNGLSKAEALTFYKAKISAYEDQIDSLYELKFELEAKVEELSR